VAGSCEHGDKPSGSGATGLVRYQIQCGNSQKKLLRARPGNRWGIILKRNFQK
jgi:hypothetical protein